MDLGIKGKVALVLGSSRGLGLAIARALADEGVHVAMGARHLGALTEAVEEIRASGGRALALSWDMSDPTFTEPRLAEIERTLGCVDILINNTGGPPPSPAAGQDASSWRRQFETLVLPVIGITDRVLPNMRHRKWGRIITSASSGVVAPIPNLGMSNSLRLALVGWSKTLAREVASDGVTSNIIVPGRIATERIKELDAAKAHRDQRSIGEVLRESLAAIPLGRLGAPEEYAAAVAFLASVQAAYITGTIMRVDGGLISSI